VVDESGVQFNTTYDHNITALAVSYMNSTFPYLRYFHGENLRLFVITGHENGEVIIWQVGQDSYLEPIES
jgi:hypothetical protein